MQSRMKSVCLSAIKLFTLRTLQSEHTALGLSNYKRLPLVHLFTSDVGDPFFAAGWSFFAQQGPGLSSLILPAPAGSGGSLKSVNRTSITIVTGLNSRYFLCMAQKMLFSAEKIRRAMQIEPEPDNRINRVFSQLYRP